MRWRGRSGGSRQARAQRGSLGRECEKAKGFINDNRNTSDGGRAVSSRRQPASVACVPAENHPGACTAGSKGGPKVGTRLSEVVRSALPPPGRAQKPGRAFRASSQLSASRASGQVPSWTQRHGLHGQSQAGRRVTGFGASPQLDAESRASVTVPSWTQSPPGTARLGGGP